LLSTIWRPTPIVPARESSSACDAETAGDAIPDAITNAINLQRMIAVVSWPCPGVNQLLFAQDCAG
jgi:hypothetical protein